MVEPDIRRARLDDAVAISRLVREAYAKHIARIGREPLPMLTDFSKAVIERSVWVLARGRAVDGVIELVPEPDHLFVENVAVRPALQGRGYGRQLMTFAEIEAIRLRLPELRLFTNEALIENIRFYRGLGYVETGREPFKGSYLVFMRKVVLA